MKERGILFSGPMVRAILDGCKTQTRRVMKPQPKKNRYPTERESGHFVTTSYYSTCDEGLECPYGGRRDRLWVRETFCPMGPSRPSGYWTDPKWKGRECFYAADNDRPLWAGKWKPSIFMPRALSRITLAVADVRVQRVRDITEEDALAEGTQAVPIASIKRQAALSERGDFAGIWDAINGKRPGCAWADNPWVWAITFSRVIS